MKRRISVLRSLGKTSEAIAALNELLDLSPTDAESWAELADLYASQGMYPQAIFTLEEVLLITPNAWNVGCLVSFLEAVNVLITEFRCMPDLEKFYTLPRV